MIRKFSKKFELKKKKITLGPNPIAPVEFFDNDSGKARENMSSQTPITSLPATFIPAPFGYTNTGTLKSFTKKAQYSSTTMYEWQKALKPLSVAHEEGEEVMLDTPTDLPTLWQEILVAGYDEHGQEAVEYLDDLHRIVAPRIISTDVEGYGINGAWNTSHQHIWIAVSFDFLDALMKGSLDVAQQLDEVLVHEYRHGLDSYLEGEEEWIQKTQQEFENRPRIRSRQQGMRWHSMRPTELPAIQREVEQGVVELVEQGYSLVQIKENTIRRFYENRKATKRVPKIDAMLSQFIDRAYEKATQYFQTAGIKGFTKIAGLEEKIELLVNKYEKMIEKIRRDRYKAKNWQNTEDSHNALKNGIRDLAEDEDPTPNKQYLEWLVRQIYINSYMNEEGELKDLLERFEEARKSHKISTDINVYKTPGQLYDAVEKVEGEGGKGWESGAPVVLDQPPYKVLRLDSQKAAAKLCKGTEWCVRAPNMYKQYAEQGPLYLVYKNGERYALVHYESGQFMDPTDKPMSAQQTEEIIGVLQPLTNISVEKAKEIAKKTIRTKLLDWLSEAPLQWWGGSLDSPKDVAALISELVWDEYAVHGGPQEVLLRGSTLESVVGEVMQEPDIATLIEEAALKQEEVNKNRIPYHQTASIKSFTKKAKEDGEESWEFETSKPEVKTFYLNRKEDETGVSGTGKVAFGIVLPTGRVAIEWTSTHSSITIFENPEEMKAVHGHGGKTDMVFTTGQAPKSKDEPRIRPFSLKRLEDETGVSGTGMVAYGAVLPSGKVIIEWTTENKTIEMFKDIDEMIRLHGHGGKTQIEYTKEVSGSIKSFTKIAGLEEKIPVLSKKYNVSEEDIRDLANSDPTNNKAYLEWIIRHRGELRDPQHTQDVLKVFEKAKKSRFPISKDINSYKSLQDLESSLQSYSQSEQEYKPKKEQTRDAIREGQEVLHNKPPYKVIRVSTSEAAARLFRGTEWCIKDPKWYNIENVGGFYYVEKDNKPYVLVQEESNQFKDVNDKEISDTIKFEEIIPLLNVALGLGLKRPELFSKYTMMDYVRIHGRDKKIEEIFKQDPFWVWWYAVNIIKGRWYEAEDTIKQDPEWAFNYIYDIIQGPWVEGEEAIKKDPKWYEKYQSFLRVQKMMKKLTEEGYEKTSKALKGFTKKSALTPEQKKLLERVKKERQELGADMSVPPKKKTEEEMKQLIEKSIDLLTQNASKKASMSDLEMRPAQDAEHFFHIYYKNQFIGTILKNRKGDSWGWSFNKFGPWQWGYPFDVVAMDALFAEWSRKQNQKTAQVATLQPTEKEADPEVLGEQIGKEVRSTNSPDAWVQISKKYEQEFGSEVVRKAMSSDAYNEEAYESVMELLSDWAFYAPEISLANLEKFYALSSIIDLLEYASSGVLKYVFSIVEPLASAMIKAVYNGVVQHSVSFAAQGLESFRELQQKVGSLDAFFKKVHDGKASLSEIGTLADASQLEGPWLVLLKAVIDVDKLLPANANNIDQLIMALDHLMDLEHNGGLILGSYVQVISRADQDPLVEKEILQFLSDKTHKWTIEDIKNRTPEIYNVLQYLKPYRRAKVKSFTKTAQVKPGESLQKNINIKSPRIEIDPTIKAEIQDAVEKIVAADPNYFVGVSKIIALHGGSYGQVSSDDPSVVYLNVQRIINEVKSKFGTFNANNPEHREAMEEAVQRVLIEVISHEKGHVLDWNPEQHKFPGGEGPAQQESHKMLHRLFPQSLVRGFCKKAQPYYGDPHGKVVNLQNVEKAFEEYALTQYPEVVREVSEALAEEGYDPIYSWKEAQERRLPFRFGFSDFLNNFADNHAIEGDLYSSELVEQNKNPLYDAWVKFEKEHLEVIQESGAQIQALTENIVRWKDKPQKEPSPFTPEFKAEIEKAQGIPSAEDLEEWFKSSGVKGFCKKAQWKEEENDFWSEEGGENITPQRLLHYILFGVEEQVKEGDINPQWVLDNIDQWWKNACFTWEEGTRSHFVSEIEDEGPALEEYVRAKIDGWVEEIREMLRTIEPQAKRMAAERMKELLAEQSGGIIPSEEIPSAEELEKWFKSSGVKGFCKKARLFTHHQLLLYTAGPQKLFDNFLRYYWPAMKEQELKRIRQEGFVKDEDINWNDIIVDVWESYTNDIQERLAEKRWDKEKINKFIEQLDDLFIAYTEKTASVKGFCKKAQVISDAFKRRTLRRLEKKINQLQNFLPSDEIKFFWDKIRTWEQCPTWAFGRIMRPDATLEPSKKDLAAFESALNRYLRELKGVKNIDVGTTSAKEMEDLFGIEMDPEAFKSGKEASIRGFCKTAQKMTIGIDIDDVLADFHQVMWSLAEKYIPIDEEDKKQYVIQDTKHGSLDLRDKIMEEMYQKRLIANMPEIPGAVEQVNKWHDAGHKIVLITARSKGWEEQTKEWLDKVGLKYDKLIITNHQDKAKFAEDEGVNIFIDDSVNFLENMADKGIKVYVFDQPWNTELAVPRIRGWRKVKAGQKAHGLEMTPTGFQVSPIGYENVRKSPDWRLEAAEIELRRLMEKKRWSKEKIRAVIELLEGLGEERAWQVIKQLSKGDISAVIPTIEEVSKKHNADVSIRSFTKFSSPRWSPEEKIRLKDLYLKYRQRGIPHHIIYKAAAYLLNKSWLAVKQKLESMYGLEDELKGMKFEHWDKNKIDQTIQDLYRGGKPISRLKLPPNLMYQISNHSLPKSQTRNFSTYYNSFDDAMANNILIVGVERDGDKLIEKPIKTLEDALKYYRRKEKMAHTWDRDEVIELLEEAHTAGLPLTYSFFRSHPDIYKPLLGVGRSLEGLRDSVKRLGCTWSDLVIEAAPSYALFYDDNNKLKHSTEELRVHRFLELNNIPFRVASDQDRLVVEDPELQILGYRHFIPDFIVLGADGNVQAYVEVFGSIADSRAANTSELYREKKKAKEKFYSTLPYKFIAINNNTDGIDLTDEILKEKFGSFLGA